ncbi:MAG: hypothetical protein EA369_04515 [Bradymonadales bacterium]|nr:MAG: hypothetical protein EA369_04515 [Bradymonadales bacterium]
MPSERFEITITKEMIEAYAEASGDHNPIHLSAEAARAAGLERPIAHGMLSLGLSLSAVESFGYSLQKLQLIETKFKDKLYQGEKLQVELTGERDETISLLAKSGDREILSLQLKLQA